MSSKQIGTGLVIKPAPTFTNYVVVRDTWKEKANDEYLRTDGGDSAPANYTFWNPGVDATCDVVIKKGQVPLEAGEVLEALAPDSRKFIVLPSETSSFGASPLKQSLQLAYHEGFTATPVVDEEG